MAHAINMTGRRSGRLLVVRRARANAGDNAVWVCLCDCGQKAKVNGSRLRSEIIRSCGCLRRETTAERNTTHGMNHFPEMSVWRDMKRRCLDPRNKRYDCYGQRGISICDRWLNSFPQFISDMGRRPSIRHSIERINNDGNYEPGNCKWATPKEQARNRRRPRGRKHA